MTFSHDTFSTPVGDFSVAVDAHGAIVATAFGDRARLAQRLGASLAAADAQTLREVRAQVRAYFSGTRRAFDLPLAPHGTTFQHQVWSALREIPPGETRSYGELAAHLGRPGAARAVGRANATNPVCLFIPCHRVIGANGSLTGFAFGTEIKERLLAHERGIGRAA